MRIVQCGSRTAEAAITRIERGREHSGRTAEGIARRVIDGVRRHGDEEVSRILARFDKVEIAPSAIWTTPETREIGRPMADAIELAIERIERFHSQQTPHTYRESSGGTEMIHRVRPLRRVGVYAPGGRAVYLSTLIMCAVPARLAGVKELVVATPPAAADRDEFHYACSRLGFSEIYRAGGPAGIAAMALGTSTLRRVDKIVGPGNAYVTAAKKLLVGKVGIDMLAGPTELVLIADDEASPRLVAADLLAQAEHGADSSVICIAFSRTMAREIAAAVERRLQQVPPSSAAHESLSHSGLIAIARSPMEAVALANRIAPEHLSLHWNEADRWLDRLDNSGAIFVGPGTPVAAGDYIAGPNHVLPTGGTARFASPLGVYDFVKRSNIMRLSPAELREISRAGETIARFEGLPLHAESLALRAGNAEKDEPGPGAAGEVSS
jgi:histidinol dehydrogenase